MVGFYGTQVWIISRLMFLITQKYFGYWYLQVNCLLVWVLVPAAILSFIGVTQSQPGYVEKRPVGRSGVEEMQAEIDSDDAPCSAKGLNRICTECWVLKDLRTKHDAVTNGCVREFDHYCGWLGLPIGKGNHRQFIALCSLEIVAQFAHFLLLCRCCAFEATREHEEDIGTLATIYFVFRNYSLVFGCLVSHVLTIPWIICLTGFHFRLVCNNLTTNESINMSRYEHFWVLSESVGDGGGKKRVFHNPWDKGSWWNNTLDFWVRRQRSEVGSPYKGVALSDLNEADDLWFRVQAKTLVFLKLHDAAQIRSCGYLRKNM